MKTFSFLDQLQKEQRQEKKEAKSLDDATWEVARKMASYTTDKLQAATMLSDSNSIHLRFVAECAKAELEKRGK